MAEIRQKLGDNVSEEDYVELLKEFKLNKKGEVNIITILDK